MRKVHRVLPTFQDLFGYGRRFQPCWYVHRQPFVAWISLHAILIGFCVWPSDDDGLMFGWWLGSLAVPGEKGPVKGSALQ